MEEVKIVYTGGATVEVSADDETIMLCVYDKHATETERERYCLSLDPYEVEHLVSTLKTFKERVENHPQRTKIF